ncbi:MAG TPA: ABC transporter permease [Anaerolineaceae bacterium]|nr:ABC transporter permease [Anaerolineaceae bacterium]HPN51989.1 ABC transporter permease [Anaerolineaceae bacterium]
MKPIVIALKDLTRSFRSVFALVFMFGIPLMVTGMFYLMFGNMANTETGFDLPRTRVVIANLDEGNAQAGELGKMVVETLQGKDFSSLMDVSTVSDAGEARKMVDSQQAGVAIIIPADFSNSFTDSNAVAEIEVYKDPTLTIGPGIVQSVLNAFTDNFAGVKITVAQALKQAEAGQIEYAQINQILGQYMANIETNADPRQLLDLRAPAAAAPAKSLLLTIVSPIMAGMMIFYAYFTGVNTANSILLESEEGTLQRLFTTPTAKTEILGGKIIAVGLTVLVQVVTLIIASRLIFNIDWGALPSVILAATAIIISASAFGVFVCSLLKSTKQGGIVFGGVLTVTGMVGMMDIFTGNPNSTQFGIVPLFTPQGWASRSMLLSMQGASFEQILPYTLFLVVFSVAVFFIGVWRFQKRFA